jgi:tetratricopeptide (TPR) repeat protein
MKRLLLSLVALLTIGFGCAQTSLDYASDALNNDDYAAVINYATDYLNSHPKDATAYAMRSLAYASQEQYSNAFADVDKAIKFWNKKCRYDMTTIYSLRGYIHEQVEEFDKALEDYNAAVKKEKKNPKAYYNRGRFYYKMSKYDAAEADYRKAHELKPEESDYTLELARALWLQDKNEDAAVLLDELMLYHPRLMEAKRIRARIYREANDYQSFIDLYAEYLDAAQENVDIFIHTSEHAYAYLLKTITTYIRNAQNEDNRYFWLGLRVRTYISKEMYSEALTDLATMQSLRATQQGIETDSVKDPYIFLLKTDCYENTYDFPAAAKCYSELIKLYPNNEYTYYYYYHRADCYAESGDYAQAEADFAKVIENDMEYAIPSYANRGSMREEQGRYDAALEDYNKALMLDEQYSYLYLMRGRLYLMHKQDTVSAMRDFQRVEELEGDAVSNARMFACVFMGKHEQATYICQQMLNDNPTAVKYYNAACVYSLLDRKQEAMDYLKTAMDKGYRNIHGIEHDDDLDNIRQMPEYSELMAKYRKAKIQGLFDKLPGGK